MPLDLAEPERGTPTDAPLGKPAETIPPPVAASVPRPPALAGVQAVLPEPGEDSAPGFWRLPDLAAPWMFSAVFHALAVLVLALAWFTEPKITGLSFITSGRVEAPATLDGLPAVDVEQSLDRGDPNGEALEHPSDFSSPIELSPLREKPVGPALPTTGVLISKSGALLLPVAPPGGGLEGRAPAAKAALLRDRGGTPGSELAVLRGLRWLAAHQMDDGSFRFNHAEAPACHGNCRNVGNVPSSTAGTALALLPFLGAGSTPREGEFRSVVHRGLYYLSSKMHVGEHGGDVQDGTMYGQGLSAIAFCEAYALTNDPELKQFAQAAVDFIVHAQHREGGWRYFPGQPGDTTSFGWQLMALKSATTARLNVRPSTFYLSSHFLDTVQRDDGAAYGYQKDEGTPTTTAIGLLSRMYLGWDRSNPALARGVKYLGKRGPSRNDMYYNYYATQIMNHWDGDEWPYWNETMREYLIQTQATEGHESGSWFFDEPRTKNAGRLYNTAMAVMILEVYYRHLPLYKRTILAAP